MTDIPDHTKPPPTPRDPNTIDMFDNKPPLIVRLERGIDLERPCCENLAMVGPAHGVHAGSLICTGCGRHRGWIPAAALENFHTVIGKNFGRDIEPFIVRTTHPNPGDAMTMQKKFHDTDRGSIWKNERKESATHPDFTGSLNVGGVEYWVSAWKRKPDASAKAPALTFSIKAKEETAKKADPISTGRPRSDDAEIPFIMEWRG